MSDEPKSTPHPVPDPFTWEAFAVFRESFLLKLSPEEASACRLIGRRIYLDHHERLCPDERPDAASWIAQDLEGAVADLAFLAGYLGDTARAPEEYSLDPKDEALAQLAAEARDIVTSLEHRLAGALQTTASQVPTHACLPS